jgi:hypothetical protein
LVDPFGYYSGVLIGGSHENKLGHMFYQEFPCDAKSWKFDPPGLIDDTPIDDEYKK